jgi:hypothetical protein
LAAAAMILRIELRTCSPKNAQRITDVSPTEPRHRAHALCERRTLTCSAKTIDPTFERRVVGSEERFLRELTKSNGNLAS